MSARSGDWLFDLGNTRLKTAALRDDGAVGDIAACAYGTPDADMDAIPLPEGVVAYVASVAPVAAATALLQALAQRFDRICIARTQPALCGVRIAYRTPARLGVDRFLALLAAHARDPGDALVVGVGTALTLDLVDAQGAHRGGRIAPSPSLMREALHARAAQLPVSGGRYAEFADDTDDALASGCEGAALALVEHSLQSARALLGATPRLLVHGGGGDALVSRLPGAQAVPSLVLEGLAQWARLDGHPDPLVRLS